MTASLSRRALFRAFRDQPASSGLAGEATAPMLAHVGPACVEPRGVMCRRCGDECEPRAISFRLASAGRAQVRIDAGACTGCGDCLAICPVGAIELITRDRASLIAGLVDMGVQG